MSNKTTQITIKPSELVEVLDHCLLSNLVPFIQAPPGVGKSTVIRQFSDNKSRRFTDTRLSYAAPTDVRGFPYLDRNGALAAHEVRCA
jgi:MoxR-like ATPase